MFYLKSICILLSSFAFYSQTGFAILDGQVFVGNANGSLTIQTDELSDNGVNFKGKESGFTVHLNPISTLPVAIGIGYSQISPSVSNEVHDSITFAKFEGQNLAFEVMAWIPLGSLAIYGKIGEVVTGNYKIETTSEAPILGGLGSVTEFEYESQFFSVGMGIPLAKGVGLLLEYKKEAKAKLYSIGKSFEQELYYEREGRLEIDMKKESIMAGIEIGV